MSPLQSRDGALPAGRDDGVLEVGVCLALKGLLSIRRRHAALPITCPCWTFRTCSPMPACRIQRRGYGIKFRL